MYLDTAIIAASAALAATAAVVNMWAARSGPFNARTVSAARGALAAVYTIAYIWLLTHRTQRLRWSQTMTGVALAAWIIVWIAPAVTALRITRRHR